MAIWLSWTKRQKDKGGGGGRYLFFFQNIWFIVVSTLFENLSLNEYIFQIIGDLWNYVSKLNFILSMWNELVFLSFDNTSCSIKWCNSYEGVGFLPLKSKVPCHHHNEHPNNMLLTSGARRTSFWKCQVCMFVPHTIPSF